IEVDYFLLTVFGYRDKAKGLLVKHNEHFKNILKNLNFKEHDSISFFSKLNIERDINHQTIEEIVIFRKLLNNIIARKFSAGIIHLLSFEIIFLLLIEGRLWKTMILELQKADILEIWVQYKLAMKILLKRYEIEDLDHTLITKKLYIHSLDTEYNNKINDLLEEKDVIK